MTPLCSFQFAVNTHGINKQWDYNLLAGKFQDITGSLDDVIQHILHGHALCAGLLNGKWRLKSNFAGSWWVLSEIDNSTIWTDDDGNPLDEEGRPLRLGKQWVDHLGGPIPKSDGRKAKKIFQHQMSIEEAIAHSFIQQHCALIYTTPSHTPTWHRFRLIWRLPQLVTDIDTYEALVRSLLAQIPHDPACKDGVRVFYGNTQAEFPLVNADAFLPVEWIEIAKQTAEQAKQEQAERLQHIQARREAFASLAQDEGWDTDALIQQALSHIPPRQPGSGNYDECRQVLMALVDHYGPSEAEAIAEEWSPSLKGTTWNIRAKIKSFKRTGITIGTLFYFAQQYGFRFPDRPHVDPLEPDRTAYDQVIRQQQERERVEQAQAEDDLLSRIHQFFQQQPPQPQPANLLRTAIARLIRSPQQNRRRRVKRVTDQCRRSHQRPTLKLKHYQPRPKRSQAAVWVTEYQPGERLTVWQAAIAQGYRYILDTSVPGTGKSHDSGRVNPADFGLRQAIYLSDQHRNPTVHTLEISNGWVDLEARHGGLSYVSSPNGTSRLQRTAKGDLYSVPANCSRNGVLNALREKQIPGSDTAGLICSTCPLREPCTNATGHGYGFLNQRRSALSSPLLRAHPDSMPAQADYNFQEALLIWDEPGHNFRVKLQIHVCFPDLQQTITALISHPEVFESVQPLLAALLPLLDGSIKLGRFGKDHHQLKSLLPDVSTLDATEIAQALTPNLKFLNTTSVYGVDLADLPRELRRKFSERDGQMAEQARRHIIKQWLPALVDVLQSGRGSIHANHQGLTITQPDWRHRLTAHAAHANIFLDATLSQEDLALKLGCAPNEIKVVRQAIPPTDNLQILQVTDMGRAGMHRGGDQQKRAAAITQHYRELDPTTRIIDFKKFAADGVWWRDSRGVNDFLETQTLVLLGTPCRNLMDLASEYGILTGCYPSFENEHLKAFIDRSILAEIQQAIGRLRAHRRLDESLKVVLISNIDLAIPVQHCLARDITISAASKTERVRYAIAQAITDLKTAGQTVTQQIVSTVTKIPRGTIARYWRLFISLIESSNSRLNKTLPNATTQVMVQTLDEIAQLSPEQLLNGLDEVFYGWLVPSQWQSVWNNLSPLTQVAVLKSLSLTLPTHSLAEILK
jgi:hypothetical protein